MGIRTTTKNNRQLDVNQFGEINLLPGICRFQVPIDTRGTYLFHNCVIYLSLDSNPGF